jgi:hypothetical protein
LCLMMWYGTDGDIDCNGMGTEISYLMGTESLYVRILGWMWISW